MGGWGRSGGGGLWQPVQALTARCRGHLVEGNLLPTQHPPWCARVCAAPNAAHPVQFQTQRKRAVQNGARQQAAPTLVRQVVHHQQGPGVQHLAVVAVVRLEWSAGNTTEGHEWTKEFRARQLQSLWLWP